jgi:hypothetical protein
MLGERLTSVFMMTSGVVFLGILHDERYILCLSGEEGSVFCFLCMMVFPVHGYGGRGLSFSWVIMGCHGTPYIMKDGGSCRIRNAS